MHSKINSADPSQKSLLNWRDLFFTVPIEMSLLLLSFLAAYAGHHAWHLGLFADVLVFYITLMGLTIITLKIVRTIFPPMDGHFTQKDHPNVLYIWRLINFLSMTNLFLHYQCSLLPTPIRKFFSQLLGAQIGKGLISIGGLIVDPYAITIEEEALIGHEALLLPSTLTADTLIRKRITVGRGAVIGARSILMPGVTVGEGSMVKAMSVVAQGTHIPPYEVWGGIPAVKMDEQPRPADDAPRAFAGWRDMIISPLVETGLLGMAGYAAWHLAHYFKFGLFGGVILFYCFLVGLTLITLQALRWAFPFKEGRYSFKEHPWVCYRWSLHGFLCIMNLFLHFQNGLISPALRRLFSRILGAKIKGGQGLRSMAGLIQDPYMVEIEAGSVICHDALIIGHAITQNELILSRVKIDENVVLGPRSLIMPGVTLGQGARVGPLSLVTTGKTVNPGETWFGVPARKVTETQSLNSQEILNQGFKTDQWDIIFTVSAEVLIWGLAALGTAWLAPLWWGDGFACLVTFHLFNVLISLTVLGILRQIFAFKPGIYTQKDQPNIVARWRLYGFICITDLNLYYFNGLLPPHLRKIFLRLLGLRTQLNDLFSLGGLVLDPHLVKIGRNSIVGLDALVTPLQVTENSLILGQVHIGDRVLIGPRAVISPNVVIGEGAIVEPMSLVTTGTTIPPFEIWGGIPAQKRGEVIQSEDN